jgi:PleD family two-component response regulator
MELSLRLLHLPVEASSVTRELGPSGPSPVRDRDSQKRHHRSARILIVDDEPAAAEAVRDHLLGCGHTVDMAFGADDALTAVQKVHRDVVLVDSGAPEVDGVEGLRRIRALDSTVPVIVDVMKPIDFALLDRAIAAALTSRDGSSKQTLVEGGAQ